MNQQSKKDWKNVFRSVRRIDNRRRLWQVRLAVCASGLGGKEDGGKACRRSISTLEDQRHPMTTRVDPTREPKEQDCTSGGRRRKRYSGVTYECKTAMQ
jgi:hypothetical protein